jgi:hypothetical protein
MIELTDCHCRELGFDVVEVNASDTRNKADSKLRDGIGGKLSNRVKELVTNSAIASAAGDRKQVLVMDEVDGMSGALPTDQVACSTRIWEQDGVFAACYVAIGASADWNGCKCTGPCRRRPGRCFRPDREYQGGQATDHLHLQ